MEKPYVYMLDFHPVYVCKHSIGCIYSPILLKFGENMLKNWTVILELYK